MGRCISGWLLVLAVAGCTEPIDKPRAPDMSALIEAYDAPAGVLDDSTQQAVGAALDARFDALSALCGWERLAELACATDDDACQRCTGLSPITAALSALDDRAAADGGMASAGAGELSSKIEGDGFFRLTRICPGGDADPVPDREHNGQLQLVVGFTEAGLDPVLFGELDACVTPDTDGGALTLWGKLNLAFGEPFAPRDLPTLAPIIALQGALENADGRQQTEVDLRLGLLGNAGLQFRVPLAADADADADDNDGGDVVLALDADGVSIRAANGTFACDLSTRTCDDGDGGVLAL